MGLENEAKGKILSVALNKLKDEDSGTTFQGAVLASVIASQIHYADLFLPVSDPKQNTALGLLLAAIALGVGGYFRHKSKTSV